MTTWYGFNHARYGPDPMDPATRVPDARLPNTVAQSVRKQLEIAPEEIIPACVKNPPCKTWIQWKPTLSGCAPTWLSWHDLTNGQIDGVEIGQKDTRIWVSNLSAMQYNRALLDGSQWWAESTQPHIRDRQMFVQYLQSTLFPNMSPHEKQIDRVEDSYAMLRHRYGPNDIQYTTF